VHSKKKARVELDDGDVTHKSQAKQQQQHQQLSLVVDVESADAMRGIIKHIVTRAVTSTGVSSSDVDNAVTLAGNLKNELVAH
jgi:hypothetical protein